MAAVTKGLEVLDFLNQTSDMGKQMYDAIEKSVNVKDVKDLKTLFHCNLALQYKNLLAGGAISKMDEFLQVAIAGTVRDIAKRSDLLKGKALLWPELQAIFEQNLLLEKVPESEVAKMDHYTTDEENFFKFDGSPDPVKVKQAEAWFRETLIGDADVLADSQIDLKTFTAIFASTGASINNFLSFFGKHEEHRQTIVEIGILRFPDIDNPFFKVYRIKLEAVSDCTRVLFQQKDNNSIYGEYNCCKYRPRASVLEEMSAEIREKAVNEAEAMFA